MHRYRLVRAMLPALLLVSYGAISPDVAQAQESSANRLSLQGPNGEDVLQVVKDIPAEVRAGETFEYQITVQNVSDSPLMNVMVVEQVEALQIREAKAAKQKQSRSQPDQTAKEKKAAQENAEQKRDAQKKAAQQQKAQQKQKQHKHAKKQKQSVQQQGNMIRYKIGMLAAGQSRTLNVSAVATKAGSAKACMWVDYQPTLCTTIEVVQPDFRLVGRLLFERGIEVEQDVKGIYGCDLVFLELEVVSTGDAATAPAQVTVKLPKGLTTDDGKNQLQVDLGPLEPEQAVKKQVPLKLDPAQAANEIQFPITATAGDLNAKIALPAVKILDPQLELTVKAPEKGYIDQAVEVPITVENPSEAPVLSAAVRVTGIADFDEITADGAKLAEGGAIALGRIEPGQTREFTLLMAAAKPTDATITVAAAGYCVEAVQKQAKISLIGIPAVLIEVVDQVDPVPVGENTIYEIEVLNQGTAADTKIQVSAMLPEGMEFVEGRGDTKVTAEGQTITFAPVKTLAPGDVAAWTVQTKATQAAKARLKVELTSEATDKPIIEQEPTTLYGDTPQSSREKVSKESESGGQQKESPSQNDSSESQKEKSQSEGQ